MDIFGSLNLTWVDGIIVIGIVLFVEFVIKKWICKGDNKYKAIYTFAPIVLGAIAYLIIALIEKNPWYTGLLKGVGVGLGTMGSYDAIKAIIYTKGVNDVKAIGEEVAQTVDKKEKEVKKNG